VIPDEAVEAATKFVVYGGNGRRRLGWLASRAEAEKFAADFERKCWSQGVAVPRSWIEEEK
jgi:hypothetical protein